MAHGFRILIVEDELLMGLQFKHQLESAGFETIGPVSSVAGALAVIEQEDVSAALLDYKLHKENSLPIAGELSRRGLPFAFVSGNMRHQPAEFAGVSLLRKPVPSGALLESLRRLMANDEPGLQLQAG
ncbi:hypothetical protein [Henriciella sp.]|uniref:hypothetical protein n=1 Tax=Henriciella sp. TaxID=1968823 RepID=UPI002611C9B9|nr:hypothetical protein [Henriciella sp.]